MTGWVGYFRTVKSRITWDRGLLRGLWVVPWLQIRGWLKRPARRAQIAYYPHPAGPWYTMPLALAGTAVRRTSDLSKADIIMSFDDQTESEPLQIESSALLLNEKVTDISKAKVGRVFQAVFGYSVAVDPQTHIGRMVEKSDENGVHDGRLVDGPLSYVRLGLTHQKLVDSMIRPGVSEDLRCVCLRGEIIVIFRKEKALGRRFSASYLQTECHQADEYFSSEEQVNIARFCQEMGLDFGSIDVLRDYAGDGRIYIVDVNKTCMPVLSMPTRPLGEALDQIGEAVEGLILPENPKF